MRIALMGNCQVRLIAEALRRANPDVRIAGTWEIHEVRPEDEAGVLAVMDGSDLVLSQRTGDGYTRPRGIPRLSTAALKARATARVLSFPALHFKGHAPDVRHLMDGRMNALGGPLGNYHVGQIVDAWRAGRPAAEAASLLDGEALLAREPDPFAASLADFAAREAETDVVFSDVVARHARAGRQFHTPGHPSNLLLLHFAMRIARVAGIGFDPARAAPLAGALDLIDMPTYPAIRRRYRLPVEPGTRFLGVRLGRVGPEGVTYQGRAIYDRLSVTEAFYRFYDAVGPLPG
ncbi:WcbI family polysaccharide biosynthesis putative acetyltransferase [Neoroseomonas rubea]|uniref:WcbI family polysaccharide biosynthesis putative acetyltransferase n=1 Tax=Neoroseomonas rubea TaxID=2748666 RepID=UPI0018DF621E|nr:WcbI family polysaccharide biosynthesis putative acetyltransferase [Roseomonas rubea]